MRRLLAVTTFALFAAAELTAVTVAPLSFAQLVDRSAAVVLARVVEVRGEFIGAGRGIESVVTLDVIKGLKGSPTQQMQFTVPGGQAGRYLNVIPGAPTFAAGDVVFVFLTSRGARLPVTTGLTQGIYRVRGGMVMPPIGDAGQLRRGDPQRKPVSVESFEASVRATMDRAR